MSRAGQKAESSAQIHTLTPLALSAPHSVSSNGNMLYFAYTNGTVVAVNVATFATEPPTGFPTKAPSKRPVQGTEPVSGSNQPTASPSLRGSNNSTSSYGSGGGGVDEAENESTQGSALPISLPVILGAAAGALLLLIAVVVLVMCCRRRSRGNKADKDSSNKELEAVRKWNEDKEAYNKACKQQEQETLKEISSDTQVPSGPTPLPTPAPTAGKKKRSSSASRSIPVASPLDSITEDADFDDGSEAGIEVSIADMSAEQMAMSDDESLKKGVVGKQLGSSQLLEPLDPTLVSDFDDSTSPEVEVDEDMTPIVRNLSNSFSDVASTTSPPKSEKCAGEVIVASKPDPEETGGSTTESSPNAAHLELLNAVRESRKAKKADASVLSGASTADVVSEPVIYRPEDDIVQSSSKQSDSIDFRGRPTSPDFSEVWSVDGSVYVDEESKATLERSLAPSVISQPDDEPGQISKGYRAKSPEPQIRSFAAQVATPTKTAPLPETSKRPVASSVSTSRNPAAGTVVAESAPVPMIPGGTAQPKPANRISSATKGAIEESKVESNQPIPPRPVPPSRVSPQVRGGSARPRAGLFTRRENPLVSSNGNSSDSGSEVAPKGYMPEREARASYTPIESKNAPIPLSAVRSLSPRSASSSKATERVSNQATNATRMVEPGQPPQRQSSLGHSTRTSPSRNTKKPGSESRLKETPSKARSSQNQKPGRRPQSKSGAYAAWDSFLSELAKVEDTFFNPKLGSTQATGSRERKRSGRPPARRSRSADSYYNSDSDSESTFSAGLNPVV